MKTLLILRHAKSSWEQSGLGDHDRPLNGRGKLDAPRMGNLLRKEDLVPELIITSSARRALKTAELVAEAAGYETALEVTRNLYHAGPENYYEVLSGVDDSIERVMVVGHNPGMEELVEELAGQYERIPTAALAQIELSISSWQEMDWGANGRLVNLWRPRELKAD